MESCEHARRCPPGLPLGCKALPRLTDLTAPAQSTHVRTRATPLFASHMAARPGSLGRGLRHLPQSGTAHATALDRAQPCGCRLAGPGRSLAGAGRCAQAVLGQCPAGRRAALGQRVQRSPVRRVGRPAGRRTRTDPGRPARCRRHAAGNPAQGQWPDPLLPHGGWPCGAAFLDPRVHRIGGHAGTGHSHHARAVPDGVARSGLPRTGGNRRGGDALCPQLCALWPLRTFRLAPA